MLLSRSPSSPFSLTHARLSAFFHSLKPMLSKRTAGYVDGSCWPVVVHACDWLVSASSRMPARRSYSFFCDLRGGAGEATVSRGSWCGPSLGGRRTRCPASSPETSRLSAGPCPSGLQGEEKGWVRQGRAKGKCGRRRATRTHFGEGVEELSDVGHDAALVRRARLGQVGDVKQPLLASKEEDGQWKGQP